MRPGGGCHVGPVTGVKRLDPTVPLLSVTIFQFRIDLGRTAHCGLHFECCQKWGAREKFLVEVLGVLSSKSRADLLGK
jgi:hypothetical protein